ncbi:MAG: hypothetical protein AAB538_01665 [Patescibacteria group bacterium]
MIRQIKYRKKIYIFPAGPDPLEWAYQIFRYNNPHLAGVTPIPLGKMRVALNEKNAREHAEQIRVAYNLFAGPEDKEAIRSIQELICNKYPY